MAVARGARARRRRDADRPLDARARRRSTRVDAAARRLHRRRPGPRDADEARPPGGRRRARPLRRRARAPCRSSRSAASTRATSATVLDAGADAGRACCARSPTPTDPSGPRARCATLLDARRPAMSRSARPSAPRRGRRERAPRGERELRARGARAARRAASARRRCSSRSAVCVLLAVAVLVGARDASTTSAATAARCPARVFLAVVLALLARACTAAATGRCSASRRCSPSRSSSPRSRSSSPRRSLAAAVCLRQHRPRRLAVLEAGPRDGAHPGRRTRPRRAAPAALSRGLRAGCERFDRLSRDGRELLRLHRHRLRARRLRRRDPRRAARHEDRRRRARQGRRALPELRLHPRQGGAALGRPAQRDPRGRRVRAEGRRRRGRLRRRSRRAARRSSRRSPRASAGCSRRTAST